MRIFILTLIILGAVTTGFAAEQAAPAAAPAAAAAAAPEATVRHEPSKTTGYERYYSRDYRFSISFPSDWELAVDADPSSLGGISPLEGPQDSFRENVLVGSFDLGSKMTLLEYFNGNLDYLKQKITDLNVISTENIKLDGNDAISVTYTSTIEGRHYKTMQVFLIKDTRGYIITTMGDANSYDKYTTKFAEIVKSFHFE